MLTHVNQIDLEYDTFGRPDQEPLLLISGLNTPMTRWSQTFCEMLVDSGFYVIRYNNRDTGQSKHFDEHKSLGMLQMLIANRLGIRLKIPYTIDDMVMDAIALLDKLGIKRAHIVGRSMGGFIAQLLASKYRDRVLTMTTIMSTTGNRKLPLPSKEVIRLLLKKTAKPHEDLDAYIQHRIRYTHAIGSKKYPTSDAAITERIKHDLACGGFSPQGGRRQLAALIQAGDIRPFLHKIVCPVLIIHGDCDPLVPLACSLDIHKNIEHSKMRVIKDMGHSLHDQFIPELIREISLMKTTH